MPDSGKELPHLVPHRRHVNDARHGPNFRKVKVAFARPPDNTGYFAGSKGHFDIRPDPTAPLRRAIIKRSVKWLRRLHGHESALVKEILGHRDQAARRVSAVINPMPIRTSPPTRDMDRATAGWRNRDLKTSARKA